MSTHNSSVVDEVVKPVLVQDAPDVRRSRRGEDGGLASNVHLDEMQLVRIRVCIVVTTASLDGNDFSRIIGVSARRDNDSQPGRANELANELQADAARCASLAS